MTAVILSEFKSWHLKFSRYSFLVLIIILSFISIASILKPDLSVQAITMFLIWLGWLSAKQSWSEIKYDEWINQSKLSVKSLMIGKILSFIIIVLLHLFFILPVFILMIIMRGIPVISFLWAIFFMILTAVFSLTLTSLFCWFELYSYEYFGTILIICWLLLSSFIPVLNLLNPFLQIKNILITNNAMLSFFAIVIYLILIISFSIFTGIFLYLKKRG